MQYAFCPRTKSVFVQKLCIIRIMHYEAMHYENMYCTHSLFYQALTCPDDRQVPSRPLILKVPDVADKRAANSFSKKKVRDHDH